MDNHEAQRKKRDGDEILEALGDVPVAYGFGCELPAVHGEPLHELDGLWHDHFDARDRNWLVILNGDDEFREIESLGLLLEAGAGLIVCDDTVLSMVTPLGVTWFFDPDTGDPLEDEDDIRYWDDQLIETLHARLTEKGKDLPDVDEIISKNN